MYRRPSRFMGQWLHATGAPVTPRNVSRPTASDRKDIINCVLQEGVELLELHHRMCEIFVDLTTHDLDIWLIYAHLLWENTNKENSPLEQEPLIHLHDQPF